LGVTFYISSFEILSKIPVAFFEKLHIIVYRKNAAGEREGFITSMPVMW